MSSTTEKQPALIMCPNCNALVFRKDLVYFAATTLYAQVYCKFCKKQIKEKKE